MAKIGRYEIESEIGRGSMGVVYLAHDPHVRRRIAVKTFILPNGLSAAQEREFNERFLREAQAAGALSHPAIVTIYDADTNPATGHPYIAMEYVEGRSLRQILEHQGRLETTQAFDMARTLAEALSVAHESGIVHRDIKPANILVRERDGQVKIVDFGVARLATSDLTGAGDVFGSPAYMSPEQFRGLSVDARSDLFSLGTILYQTLCGERPFAGEDLSALAYSVVHTIPPAMSSRVQGLPAEVDRFFDKALAKEPEGRFQNGLAFKSALEQVQGSLATATLTSSASRPALPEVPVRGRSSGIATRTTPDGKGKGKAISPLEGTFAVVMLILALLPGLWALWSGHGSSSARSETGPPAEAAATSEAGSPESNLHPEPDDEGTAARGNRKRSTREASGRETAGGNTKRPPGTPLKGNSAASGTKKSDRSAPAGQTSSSSETSSGSRAVRSTDAAGPRALSSTEAAGPRAVKSADSAGPRTTKSTETAGPRTMKPQESAAQGTRKDQVSGAGDRSHKATAPAAKETPSRASATHPNDVEGPMASAAESQSAHPGSAADGSAHLLIEAKSMVKLGKLTILVDGKEVYSRDLSTKEGADSENVKKKLFRRKQEHFSARIDIPPGKHEVVAIVVPDGMSTGFKDGTVVDLEASESRKLQLVAGRLIGSPVSLKSD